MESSFGIAALGLLIPLALPGLVACSEPTVYLGSNTVPIACSLTPTAPPTSLGFSSFYQKYLDASGIPILASAKVSDAALRQACVITSHLTRKSNAVLQSMRSKSLRVAVIGVTEVTLDIPEYSDLPMSSTRNWNQERGEGATEIRPVMSAGEENLLCLDNDTYAGEFILVETLAYAIQDFGVSLVEPTFDTRLNAAYQAAIGAGLWQNTMAAQSVSFYFAEGVQDWFDANQQANPANGIHNAVNTRTELDAYDPTLAGMIANQFVIDDWRPRCP